MINKKLNKILDDIIIEISRGVYRFIDSMITCNN